jgi:hypothetical protein
MLQAGERERRLWLAVLLDGLRAAQRAGDQRWHEGAAADAAAWVAAEVDAVGSLVWVCGVTGFGVARARAIVRERVPVPQRREAA